MARAAAEVLNSACSFELMRVQASDGRLLGHVFDLRCHWRPGTGAPPRIEEIIYGRLGLLERVGLVQRRPDSLPWSAVRAIHDRVIVVDAALVPSRRGAC